MVIFYSSDDFLISNHALLVLCEGNPPVTGWSIGDRRIHWWSVDSPSQRVSYAESVSISWRHHVATNQGTVSVSRNTWTPMMCPMYWFQFRFQHAVRRSHLAVFHNGPADGSRTRYGLSGTELLPYRHLVCMLRCLCWWVMLINSLTPGRFEWNFIEEFLANDIYYCIVLNKILKYFF